VGGSVGVSWSLVGVTVSVGVEVADKQPVTEIAAMVATNTPITSVLAGRRLAWVDAWQWYTLVSPSR